LLGGEIIIKYSVESVKIVDEFPIERYRELGLDDSDLLRMFEVMLRIRRFEEAVERLFIVEGKLIGPCHLYLGQEAVATGVIYALHPDDPIISTHRNHGHGVARGVPFKDLMAELFGKATGTCRGLGGSMHAALSLRHSIPVATAIVGSGIPIACGIGLGIRYLGLKKVATVFFGDGAVNTGAFNEGLNLAAVWRLPVLFVCENNYYALSTPFYKACAGESIAARAASYGVRSYLIPDANDVLAVYSTAKEAAEYIREGNGPVFIECRAYRKKGHGVYDTGFYRPREEVEFWMKKDPIERFSLKLKSLGLVTDDEIKNIDDRIQQELKKAIEEAESDPVLEFNDLWSYVYVSGEARYGEWR